MKKQRGSPTSSEDSDTENSLFYQHDINDTVELDIHDSALGKHAGELLLDLHQQHKDKNVNCYEDDRKLNMLGMIVNGADVSSN